MKTTLEKMTWNKWQSLTPIERDELRSDKDLTDQLKGLEGYRVEVVTDYNEKRRFIVGRSTGWSPIHLEINNHRSSGGPAAEKHYKSVKTLYFAR